MVNNWNHDFHLVVPEYCRRRRRQGRHDHHSLAVTESFHSMFVARTFACLVEKRTKTMAIWVVLLLWTTRIRAFAIVASVRAVVRVWPIAAGSDDNAPFRSCRRP